jgi:hypothetical protein
MVLVVLAVHAGFYLGLRAWTDEWRVYGNGPLPDPLRLFEPFVFKSAWGAWLIGLSAVFGVFLAVRQRYRVFAVLLPLGLLALPFLAAAIKNSELHDRTVSCANHSGQWRTDFHIAFEDILATNSSLRLTNTTEFDDALSMFDWGPNPREPRRRYNLYCPGRRSSGSVTGYAFVGGGLGVREAMDHDALLVFCDAECHPPPHDHQHALTAQHGRQCVHTGEMIALLEKALQDARARGLGYSPEAVRILESELAKRLAFQSGEASSEREIDAR